MLFCITIWSTDTGICLVSIIIIIFLLFFKKNKQSKKNVPIFFRFIINPPLSGDEALTN